MIGAGPGGGGSRGRSRAGWPSRAAVGPGRRQQRTRGAGRVDSSGCTHQMERMSCVGSAQCREDRGAEKEREDIHRQGWEAELAGWGCADPCDGASPASSSGPARPDRGVWPVVHRKIWSRSMHS